MCSEPKYGLFHANNQTTKTLLLELYPPPVPTFGIEPKFYDLMYMFCQLNYVGKCSKSCIRHWCSLGGSNSRLSAHKTDALPTELSERTPLNPHTPPQAPVKGIEPLTTRLKVARSTSWATPVFVTGFVPAVTDTHRTSAPFTITNYFFDNIDMPFIWWLYI